MATTVYDYQVKTIECRNCGAPVTATIAGGEVTCGYCNAVLHVGPRVRETRTEKPLEERERIAGLWAQVEASASGVENPLRLGTPPGLEQFDAMIADPAARPAALQAYRQEWEQSRQLLAESPNPSGEQATRLFRLATRLASLLHQEQDHPRARAVLETALDLSPNPDQRDIIRCHLGRAAVRLGDISAFSAWMQDSSARSVRLAVDTDYRCAMALYYLHERQFEAILSVLGEHRGQVPLAEHELTPCLRSHALAASGRHDDAQREIRLATKRWGLGTVELIWSTTPGPATQYAAATARDAVRNALGLRQEARVTPVPVPAPAPAPTPEGPDDPTEPRSPALPVPGRAGGSGRKILKVVIVLAALLVTVPTVFVLIVPVLPMAIGDGEVLEQAMERIDSCAVSRRAVGDNVTWAAGLNSGGCKSDTRSGTTASWMMKVKGDRRRATLFFTAEEAYGRWTLREARLEFDDRENPHRSVDVVACGIIIDGRVVR
jgi:hypothetical protein